MNKMGNAHLGICIHVYWFWYLNVCYVCYSCKLANGFAWPELFFLLCSARIGRAEDDEELARERGQQRKRTKVKGKPPVLKKSKLSI